MIKIFYFSGTGNSLWSAKKTAEILSGLGAAPCELYNIGTEVQADEIAIKADAVVLVFPSYAYGLPAAVRHFVKKAIFTTPYIAAFVTFGSSPGGTLGALRQILKKKGVGKLFFGNIPSVENYLAIFGTPKAEALERRLSMQKKATEEAARAVFERRENRVSTFRPFSALVSLLFSLGRKIFYKYYRISSDCNGCGICEKICPISGIVMKDRRPVFPSKCEHCQACVNICPLRAIQFGRVKFGTPGYRHPEVEVKELGRQAVS